MYNIIPLILILISLSIVIIITVKKFSVLANLDTDNIPAEKEAKFKEKIISNRLKRNFFKYFGRLSRCQKAISQIAGNILKWAYKKLIDFKDNYNQEAVREVDSEEAGKKLFADAEELIKEEKFAEAEKKLIKIVSIDSKNIKAFKKLGQLYFSNKNSSEAKQTFEHALKLAEQKYLERNISEGGNNGAKSQLACIYFNLALVGLAMDDGNEASRNISQTLSLEPNNPRYLDTGLEISIMNKNKPQAMDIYKKMTEVNPENKKLVEFKKQIEKI